jgi:hypothetical protein
MVRLPKSSPCAKWLLILGAFALAPLFLAAVDAPTFAECQATYKRELSHINTNHVVAADAGRAYEKALEALSAEFKKQGDYDNTMSLLEEQKRFEKQKTVPADDPSGPIRAYDKARRQYHATVAEAERMRNEQRVTLLRSYTKALRDILRSLLANDKMTEGETVNTEVKRAEAELQRLEAALQASSPPASNEATAKPTTTSKPPEVAPEKMQVTQYNDSNAFIAALGGAPKQIDFSSGIHGRGTLITSFNTSKGVLLENVRFIGVVTKGGYALGIIRPSSKDYLRDGWKDSPTVLCGPAEGYTIAHLPEDTRAVGFSVYTVSGTASQPYGQDVRVTLSSNTVFTVHTGYKPDPTFVGFIANAPMKTIKIETATGTHNANVSAFLFK